MLVSQGRCLPDPDFFSKVYQYMHMNIKSTNRLIQCVDIHYLILSSKYFRRSLKR